MFSRDNIGMRDLHCRDQAGDPASRNPVFGRGQQTRSCFAEGRVAGTRNVRNGSPQPVLPTSAALEDAKLGERQEPWNLPGEARRAPGGNRSKAEGSSERVSRGRRKIITPGQRARPNVSLGTAMADVFAHMRHPIAIAPFPVIPAVEAISAPLACPAVRPSRCERVCVQRPSLAARRTPQLPLQNAAAGDARMTLPSLLAVAFKGSGLPWALT